MIKLIKQTLGSYFPNTISKDQAKDAGMAIVLVCLLFGYFGSNQTFIAIAIILLLLNMIWSNIYQPVAKLWFGLSQILGTLMSKLLLSIIFYVLVTPIGLIRKMLGADPLQLKKWKQDTSSVFVVRNHRVSSKDLEHPY